MKYITILILTFLMFGCAKVDVKVDYDDQYDFSQPQTFVIVHEAKESESSLVNDRIVDAISEQFAQRGYTKQDKHADVIVKFFYKTQEKSDTTTSYTMLGGFGRIGLGGGAMISTSDNYQYTEGVLAIDILNEKTQKTIWRGVGVMELKEQKTPQQKREYINNLVAKILEKYPLGKAKN